MKASLIVAALLAALVPSSSLAMTLSAPKMIANELASSTAVTKTVTKSYSALANKEDDGCVASFICEMKFVADDIKFYWGALKCQPIIQSVAYTYKRVDGSKSNIGLEFDIPHGIYTMAMVPEEGAKRVEFPDYRVNVTLADGRQLTPIQCDKLVFTAKY